MNNFRLFFSSRYRAIIFSIALFIVFDLSILLMNFYISNELSKDSGIVNLAGQMQMTTQRMVKALYELEQAIEDGGDTQNPLAELKQNYQSFNENLVLFQQGGMSHSAQNTMINVNKPNDLETIEYVKNIDQLWSAYKNILNPIVSTAKVDVKNTYFDSALKDAITYGSANNLSLLKLCANLGERLEQLTAEKVSRLKLVQVIGMSFAFVNFIVILFHFIGRLRKNDNEIEVAKQQTDHILNTVQEGLLLIDIDGNIGEQYSSYIEKIFTNDTIAKQSFFDLLKSRITDSDLSLAKKYIRLLFKQDVEGKLTVDLNPLKRIEFYSVLADGRSEKITISFNFSQVKNREGEVTHLLVTLRDISEIAELEASLKLAKSESSEQLQIIKTILMSNAGQYDAYLSRAKKTINAINQILESSSREQGSHHKKLDSIFIEIHRLKGDSSINKLNEITSICHQMETELHALKNKPEIFGDDFMSLTIGLKEILKKIDSYAAVANQLSNFGKANQKNTDKKICSPEELLQLAEKIAEQEGKELSLIYSEIGTDSIANENKLLIRDMLIQLLRNAVVHGIETIEHRKKLGKNPVGKIMITILQKNNVLTISVRDDGSGINFAKLKEKAISEGKISQKDLDKWQGKDLVNILFLSGISTANKLSENAGRGVGMNLVKDTINKLNGNIVVASTPQRSTSFQIKLPVTNDFGLEKYRTQKIELDEKKRRHSVPA